MRKIALTVLLSFMTTSSAFADKQLKTITVIKAGQILDVKTGDLIKNKFIIIEDQRIRSIATLKDMEAMEDEDITFIDLSDMTILPGLSDSHVHLTGSADVHGYKRLTVSTPRAAITGVRNARRTLMAGFTTVRNLGAPGFTDVALMEAIDDEDVPGPRILPAGRSIGITGGHCDSNLLPYEYQDKAGGVADGPWAVRAKVRENKKYGAKLIKFCATGGVLSKGTKVGAQQFSFEEMKAIVDEARLLGLKVAAHAHGTEGIDTAIKAGVDSIEHSSFISDDGIVAAKEKGVFLSMDVYNSDYILSEGEKAGILEESLAKERVVGKKQRQRFQAAIKVGAKMAFGSDAGVYPHGDNGKQFAYMVKWGMTPLQAVQASTLNNAELFGMSSNIGSIEEGKYADIIALNGNPLKNISLLERVPFVMKGGVVYKDEFESTPKQP